MLETERELSKAAGRVIKARLITIRQRRRVARLRAAGCSTELAVQTLFAFQRSLEIFERRWYQLLTESGIRAEVGPAGLARTGTVLHDAGAEPDGQTRR